MAIPRRVGSAAGILAVSLLLYSAVGAIWGMLRPAYTGTLVDGGQVNIPATTDSIAFHSFASFVIATGLLAVIVSLSMYVTSPSTRGPGMLWWLIAVAALSAFSFLEVGTVVSGLLHSTGDVEQLAEGDRVSIVPGLAPGVGWLAAPFMAALSYWCSALVTPDTEPDPVPIK
ncbi:hypothetical protein [Corynebacterium comes]|uniref:DUF2567 domain-containing protein n=1 Tax=Corynebacterium comes TaxID=2675218 RepID=A0A6B8VUC0_9CORY|nr:hypothetical protein [Corynebacterium comes]QGU04964.1 hypothetical protein CETAM_08550 [Corynebacterium comes]